MSEEQSVAGNKSKSRRKRYTSSNSEIKSGKALYRVKTTGFIEQYTEYTVAKRNFDSLKRKAIKEEKAFTLYLHIKDGGEWKEMEKAQISKSFYDS